MGCVNYTIFLLKLQFLFGFFNFTENHVEIFRSAGFTSIRYYRYWNHERRCVDSAGNNDF